MAILSWGKGLLETTPNDTGNSTADSAKWTAIDTPKENTLKLTPTAPTAVDATEEGGDLVDSRTGKVTYQLEFDLFVKKGGKRPWEDEDGLIKGEHAFRYTPEDEATEGFIIDRSQLHCEESYTTADGKLLHYVARCLKPQDGTKIVKPYVKGQTAAKPAAGKQS